MNDPDVTIRSLTVGELDLFDTLVLDGPAFGPPDRDYLATAADHHYRPEWTWIASAATGSWPGPRRARGSTPGWIARRASGWSAELGLRAVEDRLPVADEVAMRA